VPISSRDWVLSALKPLLEDPRPGQDRPEPEVSTQRPGQPRHTLRGIAFDTMLESYVLDSTADTPRHGQPRAAVPGPADHPFEEIAGKGAKQLTFNQIAVEQAAPYAAEDADVTLRLHQTLWPQLDANRWPAAGLTARSSCRWCRYCRASSAAAC
jgi:DNA polymerase-1